MNPAAANATPTSYDPAFFETLFQAEERHFWFRTRNRVIAATLRHFLSELPPGFRAVEVGCGTGNVLRVLETECARGTVTGMDLFPEGLHWAKKRTTCPLVVGDIHHPPFNHQFDLVCAFDVLEHLQEDVQALQSLHHMLVPGGVLMLTVPAHKSLWSYFDVAAHHCRRYSPELLRTRLREAGFEVGYLSQFMSLLFPLLWLGRRFRSDAGGVEQTRELAMKELRVIPGLNGILEWLLRWEASWIGRRHRVPLGSSLIVWARRK